MTAFLQALLPFGMMVIGAAIVFAGIHFLVPKTPLAPSGPNRRAGNAELRTERQRRRRAERTVTILAQARAQDAEAIAKVSRYRTAGEETIGENVVAAVPSASFSNDMEAEREEDLAEYLESMALQARRSATRIRSSRRLPDINEPTVAEK